MKKLALLLLVFACCTPLHAAESGDELMLVLSMKIFSDGELVSEPVVALRPGSDASVMQGLDDELMLNVVFHAVHMRDNGAEMLVDVDMGAGEAEHVKAHHVVLPWNEAYEMVFSAALDVPNIRFEVTPTRATRNDFMMRRKKAE